MRGREPLGADLEIDGRAAGVQLVAQGVSASMSWSSSYVGVVDLEACGGNNSECDQSS